MWPTLAEFERARRNGSGEGVKVTILDTGIDQTHRDFAAARFGPAATVAANPTGCSPQQCDAEDVYGHGTAIAGIVHSLAPRAELTSIRVLDYRKRQHRHEAIKCAALHALEQGAHILNCSFGMPGAAFSLPLYKSWTDRAFEQDRHVVAASSNADPDEPQWPACFSQVLAVTAGEMPPEELRHRPTCPVTFEASGVDVPVLAPCDGSAVLTGSSFAAAHLTGLLARILSCFPGLSPSFAHDVLRRLATPTSAPKND